MAEQASEIGVVGRLQRGLLTLIRIAIGWHFLYEGHAKFFSGSWTSAGYLDASRWFLGGAFQWMASHPAVIALVDAVNIGGQILIGLLLITGTLTRAASLAAIVLLLLYYLANPPARRPRARRARRRPLPGRGPQPDRAADARVPRRPARHVPPRHRPLVPPPPAGGARRGRGGRGKGPRGADRDPTEARPRRRAGPARDARQPREPALPRRLRLRPLQEAAVVELRGEEPRGRGHRGQHEDAGRGEPARPQGHPAHGEDQGQGVQPPHPRRQPPLRAGPTPATSSTSRSS